MPLSPRRLLSKSPRRHAQDRQTHLWGTEKGTMPVSYNQFKQNGLALARYQINFQEFPLSPSIMNPGHSVSVLR